MGEAVYKTMKIKWGIVQLWMYVAKQNIILIKLQTFISMKKLMDREVTFVAKDHIDTDKEESILFLWVNLKIEFFLSLR